MTDKTYEGVEAIINAINEKMDSEIGVVRDEEYNTAYCIEDETIYVGYDFDVDPEEEAGLGLFLMHMKAGHMCTFVDELNSKVWTLLHEVGHHFTQDEDFGEDDIAERAMIAVVDMNRLNDEGKVNVAMRYFDLPSEYSATEWAINFARENFELCKSFNEYFN